MSLLTNFTVDCKVRLLEHLISSSRTWTNPDLAAFFQHVQDTFEGFKGTKWEGQDLETKLRKEERLWLAECDGSRARRRGHDKGSHYDTAMNKWKKIWSELLIKDWQNEVDNGRSWDQVPESLREKLRFPAGARHSATPLKSTSSPAKPPPTPLATPTSLDNIVYEYDGEKLKRVVDAAADRAREIGKPGLAEAVLLIYKDSREDRELKFLLEQILRQTATSEQNVRFQDYVRAAKRKVKLQKAQKQKVEDGDRRAKKLAYRADVADVAGSSAADGLSHTQTSVPKLCTGTTWSRRCLCSRCQRDNAEASEDPTGVADVQHATKYVDSGRKNGPEASSNEQQPTSNLSTMQPHKLEQVSPTENGPAHWPAASLDEEDGGVAIVDTPDAQLAAEEQNAVQHVTAMAQKNGRPGSAETGVPSDSGYETAERQPHHDPLVNQILGDLQYAPSVEKVLRYQRALPTNANIKDLRKRESALEAIKSIITEFPAAKTSLTVLAQRLQERDAREAKANGEQAEAAAEAHEHEDQGGENEVTPRTRRSLRSRRSFEEAEDQDRSHDDRLSRPWPCPLAEETGCDQRFSSSGHAVRHGKIHTGVKDYNCPACDKPFARKDNMMEHFKGVHKSRVSSGNRDRRSSTLSSTDVASGADRLAAERAAKRRKFEGEIARSTRDASHSSVGSGQSVESSLTDLISFAEERRAQMQGVSGVKPALRVVKGPLSLGHTDAMSMHDQTTKAAIAATALELTRDPATLLARLETKMDAIIGKTARGGFSSDGLSKRAEGEYAMVASAESLLNIAASLQAGALEGQSPELTQFVARLIRTAAEAVIEASTSAKRSAEVARDISSLLEQNSGGPVGGRADAVAGASVAG